MTSVGPDLVLGGDGEGRVVARFADPFPGGFLVVLVVAPTLVALGWAALRERPVLEGEAGARGSALVLPTSMMASS